MVTINASDLVPLWRRLQSSLFRRKFRLGLPERKYLTTKAATLW